MLRWAISLLLFLHFFFFSDDILCARNTTTPEKEAIIGRASWYSRFDRSDPWEHKFNPPPEIPGLSLDFARDGSRDGEPFDALRLLRANGELVEPEPFDALRLLRANGELVEPKTGDERGFGQRGREP